MTNEPTTTPADAEPLKVDIDISAISAFGAMFPGKFSTPTEPIPAPSAIAPEVPAPEGLLQELVEDMLAVQQRMQVMEESLARIAASVAQVDVRVYETGRFLGGELASQRQALIDERKWIHSRSIFNAIIDPLETLRTMRRALVDSRDKHDKRTIEQLAAIETTLLTAIQGLGFREFHAKVGESFSPGKMECLGYVKGERGVVLKAVRSGFSAPDGSTVRMAGVYIAEPENDSE